VVAVTVTAPSSSLSTAPGERLSNALWKKTRRRELKPAEARLVLRGLASVRLEVTPTRQLAAGALDLALDAGCTVYDAVYLALAIHHNCRLVTADQRLGRTIRPKALVRHISVLPAID
jgi:predicted nucleic acid-binding protein